MNPEIQSVLAGQSEGCVVCGHNLDIMQTMPDGCIDTAVTSPPYFGLRCYGIPPVEWPEVSFSPMPGLPPMTIAAESSVHGLEKNIWAYVAHEVLIFREVRRLLADHGVCWINLGDSYTSGNRATYRSGASDNKGHQVQDDMPRPKNPTFDDRLSLRKDLTPEQISYVLSELAKTRATSEATQEGRE